MEPVDKFGRPIYPHVFSKMQHAGNRLIALGYRESKAKPNMFFRRTKIVTFYADMRGTELVPIWEDPAPLFYWQWFREGLPLTVRQRAVYIEWRRIGAVNPRLSTMIRLEMDDGDKYDEAALVLRDDWRLAL